MEQLTKVANELSGRYPIIFKRKDNYSSFYYQVEEKLYNQIKGSLPDEYKKPLHYYNERYYIKTKHVNNFPTDEIKGETHMTQVKFYPYVYKAPSGQEIKGIGARICN